MNKNIKFLKDSLSTDQSVLHTNLQSSSSIKLFYYDNCW